MTIRKLGREYNFPVTLMKRCAELIEINRNREIEVLGTTEGNVFYDSNQEEFSSSTSDSLSSEGNNSPDDQDKDFFF